MLLRADPKEGLSPERPPPNPAKPPQAFVQIRG
ncbi:MAG: hypothetical protein ACJAQT_003839 [Akkermansiaceae bacterium]|jgi:hypothetical protein